MLIIYNHADVICNSTFYKLMLYMPADLEAHDKPHSKFCAHFSSKGVRTIVLCLASMGTLYHCQLTQQFPSLKFLLILKRAWISKKRYVLCDYRKWGRRDVKPLEVYFKSELKSEEPNFSCFQSHILAL